MEKIYILAALIFVLFIGFIAVYKSLKDIHKKHDFVNKYYAALKKYTDSYGKDLESYTWLIKKSHQMQNQMGSFGILDYYHPPFKNHAFQNYPIIINMIPDLHEALGDRLLSRDIARQYFKTIQESLIRYIGIVEYGIDSHNKDLKNPFIWFREGIQEIIFIPIRLLSLMGLISDSLEDSIYSNYFVKLISGLVAFLGLISALVTIILGWDDFIKKILPIYEHMIN